MKRYPLQTLLKLRAHRTEKARMDVLEKQGVVRACREECQRIEGNIRALQAERGVQRHRLLDPPPAGQSWPVAMEQRQAHIDLIGERIVAEQAGLKKAQERLKAAEQALEQSKQVYFRAKGREDALEKRRDLWRSEQVALEGRREEDAAADLIQAARGAAGFQ